jgi:orotate phosphoribosyltransferase-like protein
VKTLREDVAQNSTGEWEYTPSPIGRELPIKRGTLNTDVRFNHVDTKAKSKYLRTFNVDPTRPDFNTKTRRVRTKYGEKAVRVTSLWRRAGDFTGIEAVKRGQVKNDAQMIDDAVKLIVTGLTAPHMRADVVMPIGSSAPLARRLAQGIATGLNLPLVDSAWVKAEISKSKHVSTRSDIPLTRTGDASPFADKKVIIVDDVTTSDVTIMSHAVALYDAGAAWVYAVALMSNPHMMNRQARVEALSDVLVSRLRESETGLNLAKFRRRAAQLDRLGHSTTLKSAQNIVKIGFKHPLNYFTTDSGWSDVHDEPVIVYVNAAAVADRLLPDVEDFRNELPCFKDGARGENLISVDSGIKPD